MKKALLVFLSALLCASCISISSVAQEEISLTNAPFSSSVIKDLKFDGSGTIVIILQHDFSIVWREYTPEDFPELDLESVRTPGPCSTDQKFIEQNYEYRNFVYITLNDKSDEAVIDALKVLDKRSDLDIYWAQPLYDDNEIKWELDEDDVIIDYHIEAFGDANYDKAVNMDDVTLMLKYIAGWQVSTPHYLADVNQDGDINLTDVSLTLKLIAGWEIDGIQSRG